MAGKENNFEKEEEEKVVTNGKRWKTSDGLDVSFPHNENRVIHINDNYRPDRNPDRVFPECPKVIQLSGADLQYIGFSIVKIIDSNNTLQ